MQSFRQQRMLKGRLQLDVQRTGPHRSSTFNVDEEKACHGLGRGTTNDIRDHSVNNGTGDQIEKSSRVTDCVEWGQILNKSYDDLINPKSWSVTCRWMYTVIIAGTGCLVSFASSNAAPTVPQAMIEYGITEEVALLACTTYFITFGVGTMIAAPLTEIFGRYVATYY